MDFTRTEEQKMLAETVRRFLDDRAGMDLVRRLMDTDDGFDEGLWEATAQQGWQAMAIPEQFGGAGFSMLEQGILMEEMGRALFPSPYLSSVVLGAGLVLAAGSDPQKEEMLPGVASGERRLAVALLEPGGDLTPDGITTTAGEEGSDLVVDGYKAYVLDGHTAHDLLVVARRPGTRGEEGIVVVRVPGNADGVERRPLGTLDQTRKQAEVSLSRVRVARDDLLAGGWGAVQDALTNAMVALAYEQVGGAQRCLDMAVDYARVRVQFGRPIGSFQAVKHKCADMLVEVEAARSAAYYAGAVAASKDSDLQVAAHLAKSYCSEVYVHCAAENIQIHGGIGFTWEHDAHLFLKRAKSDSLLFGSPVQHRAALAEELGF